MQHLNDAWTTAVGFGMFFLSRLITMTEKHAALSQKLQICYHIVFVQINALVYFPWSWTQRSNFL